MFADMVKIPELPSAKKPAKSSVYVEHSVWVRLGEIALELGRSRNLLVRGILKDWVADYDAEKKQGQKSSHR
jgi:hypothetical protein